VIQKVTRLRRYRQIADVLIKYGSGILLEELDPRQAGMGLFRKKPPDDPRSVYEHVRLAIEELGPTYVKFGQIMSTHREILPPGLVDELVRLQDRVTPLPFEEVRPVIEECCGPLSEAFESVEEVPIASASLAQVHRAVLHDGSVVVLKVQRPGIQETIETDLVILEALSRRVEAVFPQSEIYNRMVQEFSVQIRKELNFVREGRNAERLSGNLRDMPRIRVPEIYWDYTCSRLLTMEYVQGVRIDNVEALSAMGVGRTQIAGVGFRAYLQQIFQDGFFHADPHPGNLLVTPSGELLFLDFGMMGIIRPEMRDVFIRGLVAIVNSDVEELVDIFEKLGVEIREDDREPLKDELYLMLCEYQEFQVQQFDFGGVMRTLPDLMRRYHLRVPLTLMQILKVLWMVFDLAILLDPEFNFNHRVRPYMENLVRKRFASTETVRKASRSAFDAGENLLRLPRQISDTMRRLAAGKVRLEISDTDLIRLGGSIDQASNKLLIGLVTASLVVGSSVVLHASDVPVSGLAYTLALFGFAFAVMIGIYALYSVFRDRG